MTETFSLTSDRSRAMIAMPIPFAAGTDSPRVSIRSDDALRRVEFEHMFGHEPEATAEVLLIDLPPGGKLPQIAAGFRGKLLLLTDDMALGADLAIAAVLRRDATEAQIRAAAFAAAEGLLIRAPVAQRLIGHSVAARPLLTPREVEILGQVGDGMSNKEIARRLGISAHTVKYHLEAIFSKLGARSRAEAVSRGLRHGLLHA